ncbi:MAG: glycosyl hydrolase family 18 protein [Patescibacteria group bacterium]
MDKIILIFGLFASLFTSPSHTILSPVPSLPTVLFANISPKKVFGFLPFWTIKDVNSETLKNVDVIYYFSLTVKSNGEFDKADPGYARLGELEKFDRKFGLTISSMNQDTIAAVINSPTRRQKVIDNTIKLIKLNNFLTFDVNLDFEYVGVPPNYMVENFSNFVSELTTAIHQQGGTLSVATLSDAVWKVRLYDIKTISKSADYVIVMAYDFTRLNSQAAGPIAPLFGKEKYEYDVYSTIADYLRESSPAKIVLGVPFYGYEWPVLNNQPNSFVLGASSFGPALSTYKRTLETISKTNSSVNFDDYSKSPWFSYFDKDSRTWRQVWFENERSLGLKLDFVNQANLSGIAIWALGYDGNVGSPLWQVIAEKIK